MVKLTVYIKLLDHQAFNLIANIALEYELESDMQWSKETIEGFITSDCKALGWETYEVVDYYLG